MPVSSKVGAATLAAAIASVLVWLAKAYGGIDIPDAVQGAIVVILTLATGWLVPEQAPSPSAVATVKRQHLA